MNLQLTSPAFLEARTFPINTAVRGKTVRRRSNGPAFRRAREPRTDRR